VEQTQTATPSKNPSQPVNQVEKLINKFGLEKSIYLIEFFTNSSRAALNDGNVIQYIKDRTGSDKIPKDEIWEYIFNNELGSLALEPSGRKALYRLKYDLYGVLCHQAGLDFMNHGMHDAQPSGTSSDDIYWYAKNLYRQVAGKDCLPEQRVLETGCGNGGGADFLFSEIQPTSYTAIDISPRSIEYCKKHHTKPGLSFIVADAENTGLPSKSYDLILSVASVHCYPNIRKYMEECSRLLEVGGRIKFAGELPTFFASAVIQHLHDNALILNHFSDITLAVNLAFPLHTWNIRSLGRKLEKGTREIFERFIDSRGIRNDCRYLYFDATKVS
jgi:SAM-dependent methyltransferase